jgi:nitronate monooxygenase
MRIAQPGVLQARRMSPADPLHSLRYPIVQAPMAGGPSTPALAAAVSRAGGLGFLAAGYKTVEQVERELVEVRSLVPAGVPYGLNLFAPPGHGTGAAEVDAYADTLRDEAQVLGVDLANPANYYVNVHTQACPRGTIRGQLG